MTHGIRAVTFDLWNTLVHNRNYGEFRLPYLKEFLQTNGVELDDARLLEIYQTGFRYSSELHRTSGRRHVYTNEIISHIIEQVGLTGKCNYTPLVKTYEEAILNDPPKLKYGTQETLETLYGRIGIGLISDSGTSPGRVTRMILDDYGILKFFNVTIFSDEVGYCKPDEVGFRAALEALGVKPEEALHVGDLIKNDIRGAKKTGMLTAWLKTGEQEYLPEDAPDYIIMSLSEVIGIVETLL